MVEYFLSMNKDLTETLTPELCASKIFEISGMKYDPDAAADLMRSFAA